MYITQRNELFSSFSSLAWDSINVEWLLLMLIDVSRLSFTESNICFILLLIRYQNNLTNQHISIFTTKIHCESESFSVMSDSLWPRGLYSPWNSPGQNTGVGSLSLLQGNLPNPGIKPRSPALQVDSLPAEPQALSFGKAQTLWKWTNHFFRVTFGASKSLKQMF